MTDEELSEFDSGIRMVDFVEVNSGLFSSNPKVASVRGLLDADISVLEAAGAVRVSASGKRKDGTADKKASKKSLSELIRKIVNTAAAIKKDDPNFDNKFKIGRGDLGGQGWVDAGNAFIIDLPPAIPKFVEFGLSNKLVEMLTSRINAYEDARRGQNAGRGSGVAATAQTKAAIKSLMKNRRTLALIVGNMLEELGDAGKIAEWESACHIERTGKKKKDEVPPTA